MDRAHKPSFRDWAKALGGFWRSEVNDHVLATADVREGDVALDIGCGVGAAAVPATQAGVTVYAMDPSRVMRTGMALRRTWQPLRANLRVIEGTAEEIPLASDSVDVVWSVNAMHHWDDMAQALGEIRRVLRPQGRLVLVDEDFDDPDHILSGGFGSHHETYPMVDPDVVRDLATAAGFVEISAVRRRAGDTPVIQITARLPEEAG